MSAVVIPITERILSRDGIKITFFKVVVKSAVLTANFPDGIDGFQRRYRSIVLRKGLVGITFMNMAEVDAFVDRMRRYDILKGRDLAIANQLHGELSGCDGIRFITFERPVNTGARSSFPVWYACLAPERRNVQDPPAKYTRLN